MTKKFRKINTGSRDGGNCVKFCILFNLSPCARYCLLIGSQLTTWSQGNLHYIRLHFFQLDREFFCLSTQSCAALFCCRLAIRASSFGWLVGNYNYYYYFQLLCVNVLKSVKNYMKRFFSHFPLLS